MFPPKVECITTTSKSKSCELEVFQVIAPNAALATLKYYTDEKYRGETYRDYDIRNDIVVLLINHDDKTYYDNQKIDVSKKCTRQIGAYQYTTKNDFEKTVPTVEILSLLIEKYEDENFPVGLPDHVEAIKFRMDQSGADPNKPYPYDWTKKQGQ